jgi:alpha-tubulin suppressor-like RCC1 family protein
VAAVSYLEIVNKFPCADNRFLINRRTRPQNIPEGDNEIMEIPMCVCSGKEYPASGSRWSVALSSRLGIFLAMMLLVIGPDRSCAQILVPSPVQWQDFVKTTASYPGSQGSVLARNGTAASTWDADAISTRWICGDGWVEFRFDQTSGRSMAVGFAEANPDQTWESMAYSFKVATGSPSTVGCFQGDQLVGPTPSSFSSTDVFRIERVGTTIKFLKNGQQIPTPSATPSQGILFVDSAFAHPNSSISNCQYYGATGPEDVLWINKVGSAGDYGTGSKGSSISKISGTASWDADAVSSKAFAGDGVLRFKVGQTDKTLAIGLGTDNPDRDFASLNYAFHVSNTTISVYESGVFKTSTTYTTSDVFSIRRTGTTITYAKNDSDIIQTTNNAASNSLFVDCALFSSGATFTNCQIEGYPLAEAPAFSGSSFSASYASTGATLTSTSSTGGALTSAVVTGDGGLSFPNNGILSFSFGQLSGKNVIAGLTSSRTPGTPTSSSISFGIRGRSDGVAEVVESGSTQLVLEPYAASDRFEVRRVNGFIEYVKNGVVRRSVAAPTDSLSGAFSFAESAGKISNVVWYTGETDLLWRKMVQSTAGWSTSSNGTLTRGAALAGWTSDALGTRQLVGDGYIQWKFATPAKAAMVGLSPSDKGSGNGDLQYAIFGNGANGLIEVWENGAGVGSYGGFDTTQTFRIRRTGTTIRYSKIDANGVETFLGGASSIPATTPLVVDCALQEPNVMITDCRIAFGDSDGDQLDDQWEMGEFGSLDQTATGDLDSDGNKNIHEFFSGTFADENHPPTIGLTVQTIVPLAEGTLKLVATPNDIDGNISHVDFYVSGFLVESLTNAPWEVTLSGLGQGLYLCEAVVVDSEDLTASDSEEAMVDYPTISVTVLTASTTEGSVTPAKIRVSRSGGGGDLPIFFQFPTDPAQFSGKSIATPGNDYSFQFEGVIPNGSNFVDVPIAAISDMLAEGTESVMIELVGGGYVVSGPSIVEITITDNPPIVSVAKGVDAQEGGSAGTFVFTRTGPLEPLTAYFALGGKAIPFSDYQSSMTSGIVNFTNGQNSVTLSLNAIADSIVEGSETVTVKFQPGLNSYLTSINAASLTIHDTVITAAPRFWPSPNDKIRTEVYSIVVTDPSATIRYTTDGTEPTASSNVFISGGCERVLTPTIKAKCFSASAPPSATVTAQYSGNGNIAAGLTSSFTSYQGVAGTSGVPPVYGWGSAGDSLDFEPPTQITGLGGVGVRSVAVGSHHVLVVRTDGEVYSAGSNVNGELGVGGYAASEDFMPCLFGPTVIAKAVAAGVRHSLVLTDTGQVYSFGDNSNSQLGYVSSGDVLTPTPVPTLSGVVAIAAGQFHSLALLNDGTVYSWGFNNDGQLGLGHQDDTQTPTLIPMSKFGGARIRAIAASHHVSMALDEFGQVWEWGVLDSLQPIRMEPVLSSLPKAVQIAAGHFHRMALQTDGRIAVIGDNDVGQRGIGLEGGIPQATPTIVNSLENVLQISTSSFHALAITADGDLYGWGDNFFFQVRGSNEEGDIESQYVGLPAKIMAGVDSDFDSLTDWEEQASGQSNPLSLDSNNDGLSDYLSNQIGINPSSTDSDGDGLSNAAELLWGTSPLLKDTDGDGAMDSLDAFPTDPTRWLPPGDGGAEFFISLDTPAGAIPL